MAKKTVATLQTGKEGRSYTKVTLIGADLHPVLPGLHPGQV